MVDLIYMVHGLVDGLPDYNDILLLKACLIFRHFVTGSFNLFLFPRNQLLSRMRGLRLQGRVGGSPINALLVYPTGRELRSIDALPKVLLLLLGSLV